MDCLGILSCHEENNSVHQGPNSPPKATNSSPIKQQPDETQQEEIIVAAAAAEEEVIVDENGAAALEAVVDEERSVCGIVGGKQPISAEEIHFFPPGRIRLIVAERASDVNNGADEEIISMRETPRHLYGKIRLSPNIIKDHYMPAYKKMIDRMIESLRKKESS